MVERMGIDRRSLDWSGSFPVEYAEHKWDGTRDPFVAIAKSVALGLDTAVESGTGTGKTFFGALLTMWFLDCYEDSLVVTTAPKKEQLTLHIWKEIGRLWQQFRAIQPTADKVELRARLRPGDEDQETWAAVGYACGVEAAADFATRAQGFHAEHMLIMTEETPGIHPAVMLTMENTCVADHNFRLAWGNPDSVVDTLHLFAMQPTTKLITLSALDHPNVVLGQTVVKGAVSRRSVEARRAKYYALGRPELYNSRVRGIPPEQAANALIKRVWCEAAAVNFGQPLFRLGKTALGVDVAASEHGDRGATALWQGAHMDEITSFTCPDPTKLGLDVAKLILLYDIEPQNVGVDSVGVGAATVGRLAEAGYSVRDLNGGVAADKGHIERFANLRSQMWWQMAEDLRLGLVAIPKDDQLFDDLCAPTYRTKNGIIIVESKEDLRERLHRSPDKGDACVYGNYVRPRGNVSDEVMSRGGASEEVLAAVHQGFLDDPSAQQEFFEPGGEYGDPIDQA
jgi:hypothetical protein